MRKHLAQITAVLTIFAFVLAGCGTKQPVLPPAPAQGTSSQSAPAPATGTPKSGGTVTIARGDDAQSLDMYIATAPSARQVYDNIYDTLVIMNPDLTLSPGLAEKWEAVDATNWRFHLRRGVKFHDGTEVTADAVKHHFDRMMGYLPDSKPGRPASLLNSIKSVRTEGTHTVVFETKTPSGAFVNDLVGAWSGIPCPEQVKKLGDKYGEQPCGSGPFKFGEWKKDQEIVLVKNPDYWRGPAHLDKVVFRVIPDEKTRVLALERGEVNAIYEPAPHEVARLQKDAKFTVHKDITMRSQYIGYNVQRPPLDDLKVRLAFSHALNPKEVVDFVLEGIGSAPVGFFHPKIFGYDKVMPPAFDLNKAKVLLDEAGWKAGSDGIRVKDGKRLEVTFLVTNQILKQVAEAFQGQLSKVGATVKLDYMENAAYLQKLPRGEHEIFMWGFGVATGDADYILYSHFHSSQKPGRRYTFWSNPEVDKLLDTGRTSSDQKARADAYSKILKAIADAGVMAPLYHQEDVVVVKKEVKGFMIHPGEHLRFYPVWIDG